MKYIAIVNKTGSMFPISLHEDKNGMVYLHIGAKRNAQVIKPRQKLIPYIRYGKQTKQTNKVLRKK